MRGYLDNSATTEVCAYAAQAALTMMVHNFGNPSSLHSVGFAAEQAMTKARLTVANFLNTTADTVVFTSGGTEANNLAVFGGAAARARRGKHVVTTTLEHPSVARACDELEEQGYEVTRLRPNADGMITAAQVADACRPDTVLCCVMLVNNETGARLPVEEMVAAVRKQSPNALFHCDAVQAVGKIPVDMTKLPVDTLSLSGHKLHAPKGGGALIVRKGVRLKPRQYGGEQERKWRSGTEATPALVAMGAAIEMIPALKGQTAWFETLYAHLTEGLKQCPSVVLHRPKVAVPYIVHLAVPGIRSETMLHFLAERGVYVSSGSACSKGKKSEVLVSLGLPDREIDSSLRLSFCRDTQKEDIDLFLASLREAMTSLVRV